MVAVATGVLRVTLALAPFLNRVRHVDDLAVAIVEQSERLRQWRLAKKSLQGYEAEFGLAFLCDSPATLSVASGFQIAALLGSFPSAISSRFTSFLNAGLVRVSIP